METSVNPLQGLMDAMRVLPGVGPKSAQRMALHLLQHDRAGADQLARALSRALEKIQHCQRCNTFTEELTCAVCRSSHRDASLLCVVETPADLLMIEQSQAYQGLYFVLMGRISPLDRMGPREVNLDLLLRRVADPALREVVIATNFTNEGEATAYCIQEILKGKALKLTRIARGIPVGGELEYVDSSTLAEALYDRRPLG